MCFMGKGQSSFCHKFRRMISLFCSAFKDFRLVMQYIWNSTQKHWNQSNFTRIFSRFMNLILLPVTVYTQSLKWRGSVANLKKKKNFLARLFQRKSRAIVTARSLLSCKNFNTSPLLKKYLSYQHQTWNSCSSWQGIVSGQVT